MTQTRAPERPNPISKAMRPINVLVERFIPSALVFAIVLTFVVALLALVLTDAGPVEVVTTWGEGLSGLLAFITQMCLILLLGFILASTRPVQKGLRALASVPRTPVAAYGLVCLVAALASLITWGLGLVVGALLAIQVAKQGRKRGLKLHFPLLVASGYSGYVVWHMGYSGSAPLTAATPDSFVSEYLGTPLSVMETTFSTWNIIAAIVTVLAVVGAMMLVAPRSGEKIVEFTAEVEEEKEAVYQVQTPADRVDASRIPTLLVGLMLVAYLFLHFSDGGGLTLDIVNWSFLALILLMVRSPFELLDLTSKAASNVGEILLQFPLYAGIMGIMANTGLILVLSDAFVSIATPTTFGVLAFLSAGLVNLFVPSGGGQFAVQGPLLLDVADKLGVDPSIAVMALSYGDQWTNMIQPFWALPVLAIAGLKMRDILGYTTVTLLVSGVVLAGTLVIVSL
ncbi:MAG: TIGR00366 family protein [Ornithinimicrobium sp.]|uniref:short-chain fatty acid transporter n=1 Tax=Ornithinimicrobium sp. TaxID=1977084 RepID=UPI0026E07D77|nr:TIGR00366 family protein [Ornithinimicrobium sp.]MDO5740235.1 TIGR00366 family protein [Ornithinimicrobium sp.]